MMHDSILGYLRTLDFTASQFTNIFVQGNLITGEPDRLLGYPVFVNNDLPAATGATGLPVTATKHIYFGDFSKYVIRTIQNVSISRNDQLYWAGLNVGFMGYERLDGNLINQNAIKPLLQA
jgi:HK97 family phage major capsid protein